jgi:FKBP-type peptidyl-prolyl cis-trans isomerase
MGGQSAVFFVEDTIAGWREGLRRMLVGEKARLWIPADLAYGEKPGRRGVPAGRLVYDIELLAIEN